ncbi:protein kinase [Diaminobutyricimonas sp. TR449]|uniref:protein kinase domain-containing protein n=1 Tax=Diaminobutyricimonas sp. TR449 TaxID=2708076 RepID=UPI002443D78E|nr:protein kinase [Diaminobutyricimonas sp. TR449]
MILTRTELGPLQNRYRLLEAVGHGAMATVYRAHDQVLDRDVAVKIFSATMNDPESSVRQNAELQLLAGLSHHSLVPFFDAGVGTNSLGENHLYLVMEFVPGPDLKARLKEGVLLPRQVAQIGLDVADALDYIHHRGIVHRDIKPANVLMVDYGQDERFARARLTDFGIALIEGRERHTSDNATVGTAAYLSPEQARGATIGPATDIYSLGLVLLESLTGTVAFPGELVPSALARLTNDPDIPDHLPSEWRELVQAMTARDPEARPDAREVTLALEQMERSKHRAEADVAVLPTNERERIEAVRRYDILDTPPDEAFDRITAIAARVLSVPIAIISVVDHDRIWFKSHHGVELDQISRDPGFCASAILQDGPWIIEDARQDPRALANPLVSGDAGYQFYAGVPLRTADGYNLGTLCVIDTEPRTITDGELATLEDLAALVMSQLELRVAGGRTASLSA